MEMPYSPKDVFKLNFIETITYSSVIKFNHLTSQWKYPQKKQGDLEKMSLIDKIYWLYKTKYPIKQAPKGSNLENFFSKQLIGQDLIKNNFKIEREITISSVGDLINHPYLENSQESLYQNKKVRENIFGADLSSANLECPLYDKVEMNFEFSAKAGPPLYYSAKEFEAIKGIGDQSYSFMSTACNHSLDFGTEGVKSTISHLRNNNIKFHGINETSDDVDQATILEVKGIRVGNIAFTFGLNAKQPPKDHPHIVNVDNINGGVTNSDFGPIKKLIDKRCRYSFC